MKKLYTTHDYKKWNIRRSKKRLKQRLVSKEKQKAKRKGYIGLKKEQKQQRKANETFTSKKAPSNFSFIENTEAVLNYMEDLKNSFKRKQNVMINLRDITNLTNDAIVLLISLTQNRQLTNGVAVRGNYPKDEKLRKIFIESGVFGNSTGSPDDTKNYILTRQNKKADGRIADELIRRATKVIFNQEARCPGIYKALLESMANTCYHAKPKEIGFETWWLTVYHDKEDNHVSFAFIDTGVGIFKSTKMNDFVSKFATLIGVNDNREVLKEIISGRKRSSTHIPYRGKGLPTIFKGLERNYYSNLKIISNDVKADLSKNEFTKLKKEFRGTFLYWELNTNNRWTK